MSRAQSRRRDRGPDRPVVPRVRRLRPALRRNQIDLARLGIQRGAFGAGLCRNILLDGETCWGFFLYYGQLHVTGRAERFHGIRIELRRIDAATGGQRGEDFSVGRVKHKAVPLGAAIDEEDVVRRVHRQSGRLAAILPKIVRCGGLHRLAVNHGDLPFVFEANIGPPFAVGRGLFGRAA